MSAFSLYGFLSTTSGAMFRKDPVWPAAWEHGHSSTVLDKGVRMELCFA